MIKYYTRFILIFAITTRVYKEESGPSPIWRWSGLSSFSAPDRT